MSGSSAKRVRGGSVALALRSAVTSAACDMFTVVHDDGDVARDVVEERRALARLGHRESANGDGVPRLRALENRTADATRRDQTGRARSMRCNVMKLNAIALD